ncbi:hypothetical protein B566_EDAN000871 [Ephemera danica]|nr:hypothetical protein B566_EDAN000871 [Ephemera danica]
MQRQVSCCFRQENDEITSAEVLLACWRSCRHRGGQQLGVVQTTTAAKCKVVSDVVLVKPGRHRDSARAAGRWLAAARGRAILTLGCGRCSSCSCSSRLSTLLRGAASSLGRSFTRSRHHVGAGVSAKYGTRRSARQLARVGGCRGVVWCSCDAHHSRGHLPRHPEHPWRAGSRGCIHALATFKRGQLVPLTGRSRQEPKHRVRRVRRQVQWQTLWTVYVRGLQKFLQTQCKEKSHIFLSREQKLSNRPTSSESVPVLSTQDMPKDGHEERSRAEGSRATLSTSRHPRPVRAHQWRCHQRSLVPLELHLVTPEGRTLPHLTLRPVYAAQQHNGHRQYLRAGCQTALQCGRMGSQHPLLPRPSGDGPSGAVTARLERTVRAERVTVFDASARGASPGCCGSPCLTDGCGPCGSLHGPHSHLPGAGREAEGAARRLCRVQLPQGYSALHHR